jgi:hypothetical protein
MSCSCTATGSEEVEGVALVAAASVEAAEASAPVELDADASAAAAVVLVEERQGVPVLEGEREEEGEAGGEKVAAGLRESTELGEELIDANGLGVRVAVGVPEGKAEGEPMVMDGDRECTVAVGAKDSEGRTVVLGKGVSLGKAEAVARMVGGMKVAEDDCVEVAERERAVSEAGLEAELLGLEAREAVEDWERMVTEAAGESDAGAELAVPTLLPVPPGGM